MALQLAPFQEQGALFLSQRRAAYLADDMGLGKTIQAIRACRLVGAQKVLVVCPASVKYNWASEILQWTGGSVSSKVIEGINPSQLLFAVDFDRPMVFIVNYDLLRYPIPYKCLTSTIFDVGIFDEADNFQGRKSKRTRAGLGKNGVAAHCKRMWFMSGTPVQSRPRDLYPILRTAAPEVIEPYLTYDQYAKHFCNAYWDGIQLVDTGSSNEEELNTRLYKNFMLRRTKDEVLPDLPEKRYTVLSMPALNVEVENMIAKEFTFAKTDATRCATEDMDLEMSGGAGIAILRHQLALSKMMVALQLIEARAKKFKKLVVAGYHRDVMQLLWARLQGFNPAVVRGGMTAKQKHKNVIRFKDDPSCRIFLAQITAAGIGINLTAASNMFLVESSWVPSEVDQLVDRIHRMLQKNECHIEFLVYRQSVEENMLRTVIDKKQTIKAIVEDQLFSIPTAN